MANQADVIIVGAGVMGCSAAYWLSKAGYRTTLVDKEGIAAGASGMSAAMWQAVGRGAGALEDPDMTLLGRHSYRLHKELSGILPGEAGLDYGYRENPSLQVAFTEEDAVRLKAQVPLLLPDDPSAQWLEGPELWEFEPRLTRQALGALATQQAQVIAYRFVLALVQAAERRGVVMRHGTVVGLEDRPGGVAGVRLGNGDVIAGEKVVLAMGPWSGQASAWLGVQVPIYPVRGQLLELRVPDPQLTASLAYGHTYLVCKADGLTLAGTTEEHESGFDDRTTPAGLEFVMEGALRIAPSMEQAQLTSHVAGLRPGSPDGYPFVGAVPGREGVYMCAGHFRRGMVLSLVSTRIIADLVATGQCSLPIAHMDPGRGGPPGLAA